jgi:hypothetical protein
VDEVLIEQPTRVFDPGARFDADARTPRTIEELSAEAMRRLGGANSKSS